MLPNYGNIFFCDRTIYRITVVFFEDWTRRNTVPAADIAVKIADCLGTSVEYLVTGKEKVIYKEKYDNLMRRIDSFIDEVKKQ